MTLLFLILKYVHSHMILLFLILRKKSYLDLIAQQALLDKTESLMQSSFFKNNDANVEKKREKKWRVGNPIKKEM